MMQPYHFGGHSSKRDIGEHSVAHGDGIPGQASRQPARFATEGRFPDDPQLAVLGGVAGSDALPVSCLDPLLEASVAEVAAVSEHFRQGRFLRAVRSGPVIAAPDRPPAHVRHVFLPGQVGRHCKGRAFT